LSAVASAKGDASSSGDSEFGCGGLRWAIRGLDFLSVKKWGHKHLFDSIFLTSACPAQFLQIMPQLSPEKTF
jgi:hypothetical protein